MTTHAFPFQLVQEAILLGHYADAIELLRPLSTSNQHPDATFLHAYLHFWDDSLSHTQALEYMTSLADKGHAEANYILAICPDLSASYQFSLPKYPEQFKRLERAAELGSVYAVTDLAQCYLEGVFTKSTPDKAYNLLALAFHIKKPNDHYPKTYFLMGRMLVEGLMGERNLDKGLAYIEMVSSAKDDPIASEALQLGFDILDALNLSTTVIKHNRRARFERVKSKFKQSNKPRWECYLHHYCRTDIVYDLRDATFDAFTDFVFDHYPRRRRDREAFRWDKHSKIKFNAQQLMHGIATR